MAENALPGEVVRLLGEQGAFVAADDGHDFYLKRICGQYRPGLDGVASSDLKRN